MADRLAEHETGLQSTETYTETNSIDTGKDLSSPDLTNGKEDRNSSNDTSLDRSSTSISTSYDMNSQDKSSSQDSVSTSDENNSQDKNSSDSGSNDKSQG
jgi:hypothetical protein